MNDIINRRVCTAASETRIAHYDSELEDYSVGEHVGRIRGFIEGAEFILKNLWISCSEALPPLNVSVIIRSKDNEVYIARIVSAHVDGVGEYRTCRGEPGTINFDKDTYWAEIPAFDKLGTIQSFMAGQE